MHLNSKEGGEDVGVCIGELGGVEGITAILGVWECRREPLPALSQLWGSYTAAEMPRSFSSHTSPRDVLMVVVDSRMLVKDSARLSLRGVHGVATGVDFKWLALPQAGVGAELRLRGKTIGHSSERDPEHPQKGLVASILQGHRAGPGHERIPPSSQVPLFMSANPQGPHG